MQPLVIEVAVKVLQQTGLVGTPVLAECHRVLERLLDAGAGFFRHRIELYVPPRPKAIGRAQQ